MDRSDKHFRFLTRVLAPNALLYTERTKSLSDTLSNDQMRNKIARLEAKYEYEKKELVLRGEQAKKDVLNRNIVRNKELEITFDADPSGKVKGVTILQMGTTKYAKKIK